MIDDDLRALMPTERRLPPNRKRDIKERIMHEIEAEDTPTRRRRPSRRLTGGVVAAAVLTVGGAAAAAIGFGGPDPDQAQQVVESNPDPVAEVHLGEWRPVLRAESVACVGPDSNKVTDPRQIGNTFASEFPLADHLTAELLIEECASGNDWARAKGGFDDSRAKACVRDGDFLLAVVTLDGLDCGDAGVGVRPITDDDLARLNQMRALEVAVLADPIECPGLDEAVEWAQAQVDEHGAPLDVRGIDGHGAGCYGAITYWDRGEVIVERMSGIDISDEARDELTPTTAPPTSPNGAIGS